MARFVVGLVRRDRGFPETRRLTDGILLAGRVNRRERDATAAVLPRSTAAREDRSCCIPLPSVHRAPPAESRQ